MHQEHTRVPSSQITRGTCPHKDRQETTTSPRLKGQIPHNRVRLSQRAPRADAGAHAFFTLDASSLARSCKTHPFGFPEVRWGRAVSSQKGKNRGLLGIGDSRSTPSCSGVKVLVLIIKRKHSVLSAVVSIG